MRLDVEPQEVEVSVRPVAGGVRGRFEVFLLDALENGAGYCRHLGASDECASQLINLTNSPPSVLQNLMSHEHTSVSDSSCHDCLKDYSNSRVHALLDWRLGFDVWRIAAGATDVDEAVSLRQAHWVSVTQRAAEVLKQSLPGAKCVIAGQTVAIVQGNFVVAIVSHPLWQVSHAAVREAATTLGVQVSERQMCSVFDILRHPGYCLTRLAL